MFRTSISATLALICVLATSAVASASPKKFWEWPVDSPHPIVRPFIAPKTAYSSGHRGIDIAVAISGELRAPADGVVHFAGTVVDRPVLSIRHPGGLISSYEPVTSELARGDAVTARDLVGEVQPGHCIRLCVHFGVRLNGEYVSPLNYLEDPPRAILLPTRDLQSRRER